MTNLGARVLCDDPIEVELGGGGRDAREGRGIYICIADLHYCGAETATL